MNESYRQYRQSLTPIELLYDDRANVMQSIASLQMDGYTVPEGLYKRVEALTKQIEEVEAQLSASKEPEFPPIDDIIRWKECKHLNRVEEWFGSMYFDGREVTDDIRSYVHCADCGLIFSGKEDDFYGESL